MTAESIEFLMENPDVLRVRLHELHAALDDACDVAIWLSGLDCLRTNEEAWRTWEDSMRPKLHAAMGKR